MFQRQIDLPVIYKNIRLDCGYRIDLVVNDSVIVEIKAVEQLLKSHEVQLLSYLRLYRKAVGLLLNFHVPVLKSGIRRIVNNFQENSASQRLCVEGFRNKLEHQEEI